MWLLINIRTMALDRYYQGSEIDRIITEMSAFSNGSASKTVTSVTETSGVVNVSYADIEIPQSQVTNLSTTLTDLNSSVDILAENMGGIKIVRITQNDYDNLNPKDSNTLYVITD